MADQLQLHSNRPFPFFSLPGEIRNMVYSYLFDVNVIKMNGKDYSRVPTHHNSAANYSQRPHPFSLCTSLFRVSKHAHEEASSFFYGINQFILVRIGFDVRDGIPDYLKRVKAPYFVAPKLIAVTCKGHVMEAAITHNAFNTRVYVFLPLHCLPDLLFEIKFLIDFSTEWGSSISIHLKLPLFAKNTYTTQQLQRILEPWRDLHSIGEVQILSNGAIDRNYVNALVTDLTRDRFNAESWLSLLQERKDTAIAFLVNGSTSDAYAAAESTMSVMDCFYDRQSDSRGPQLNAKGDDFAKAINRLRFELELVRAHSSWLKRGLDIGLRAAHNAFNLCTGSVIESRPWSGPNKPHNEASWYSEEDRVRVLVRKSVLEAAKVCELMRQDPCRTSLAVQEQVMEMEQAAIADMEEAMRLRPRDRMVMDALRKLGWRVEFEDEGWSGKWSLWIPEDWSVGEHRGEEWC